MNWLEKGYEERFNPGVLLRPGFDPLRSAVPKILHAALVSIIKLDNLRSKAKMRLITGEEFFGVRQFGALRGRLTVFEELSVVANGGSCLL
jgi:hypothetical protein